MKILTSELKNTALDWCVAKSLGFEGNRRLKNSEGSILVLRSFNPSSNWTQGGPIIERERINVKSQKPSNSIVQYFTTNWEASTNTDHLGDVFIYLYGSTALEAAMRCFVASKLGSEVQVPYDIVHD